MKDGDYHYQFKMRVPLGIRQGVLHFRLYEGSASSAITLLGKTGDLSMVTYRDGEISARGILETLLYTLPFELHGAIDETAISLKMSTERGNFIIEGAKI